MTTATTNKPINTLDDIVTYATTSASYVSDLTTNVYLKTVDITSLTEKLNDITKKPEVPVEQRSALRVEKGNVYVDYYKDGFFKNYKQLMPAIKSVETFNNNTVKIVFSNGHIQTASVQGDDPYFFEDGILRCIVKEMIGQDGTAVLAKLLKYATKVHDDGVKAEEKRKKDKAEKEAIRERHWKRQQRRRARKEKARIEAMSDAICLGLTKFLKNKKG